jgi:hypothetical protein
MAEQLPDIDDLSIAELKRLLLDALGRIAELTAENAASNLQTSVGLDDFRRLKNLAPSNAPPSTTAP